MGPSFKKSLQMSGLSDFLGFEPPANGGLEPFVRAAVGARSGSAARVVITR
jgi:hypothetical protein